MIWQALLDKYRQRGATGLAKDAIELAAGCYVLGVYQVSLGTAAIVAVAVSLPLVVIEWVSELAEYRER